MADQKKMVEAITSMEDDFAQWYTDVVKKAELIDYSSVRGCMVLRPYGYAIWENIQKLFDARFKAPGHDNVYIRNIGERVFARGGNWYDYDRTGIFCLNNLCILI